MIAGVATVPSSTSPGVYRITATGSGTAGTGSLTVAPAKVAAGSTLSLTGGEFSPSAEIAISMASLEQDDARGSGLRIAQATRTLTGTLEVVGVADIDSPAGSVTGSSGRASAEDQALASTDSVWVWFQAVSGVLLLLFAWKLARSRRARRA
ncbi:MAG: hypothetical protein ACT4OM_09575 [Actinomycetota bacterium]